MKYFRRRPPSFQFYASNVMSTIQYRSMSLAERGLMMTMQNECWVNDSAPSDLKVLAKILGYSENEIQEYLTPNVMHFFSRDDDKITSPELLAYRKELDDRLMRQIEGGKKGAMIKKEKEKQVTSNYPEGSLVENKIIKNNLVEDNIKEQVFREEELAKEDKLAEHKEWIEDWEKAESGD